MSAPAGPAESTWRASGRADRTTIAPALRRVSCATDLRRRDNCSPGCARMPDGCGTGAYPARRDGSAAGTAAGDCRAGVDHEVEVFLSDSPEAGEVTRLVMIAPAYGESQFGRIIRRHGRGPGPADRARLLARVKSVPVISSGIESCHLDVHRMSHFRPRRRRSAFRDAAERVVARDFPSDFDVRHRHAAAG